MPEGQYFSLFLARLKSVAKKTKAKQDKADILNQKLVVFIHLNSYFI